ncbi:MAG: PHP domain protein [Candidatus Daviesbacteria bacterium GW2011_GWA2_42_7]|uniref:PHP domain protein n=1 Tax=Candidatus Daviesbacteria bacterium GW2011_GWA2_42_7 TaxID=1618425 RepID=A0A0G1BD13_9BACT|nr:MAG: PHP domain protein [Candidatus Daviesbacteria bacterium GW2011_GWA2_42_7]
MSFSNSNVAKMLRGVAAAYTLKKATIFQIRAYENAADAIEHSTSEVKDLWDDNQLDQLSGIGPGLRGYLDELFKTGKVKHWEETKKGIPEAVFEFLDIPGVGPKTALELSKFGVKSIKDLEDKLKSGELIRKGFSEKVAIRIGSALRRQVVGIKDGRMLLPYAFVQAEKVLEYLKKSPDVVQADALGSLRRMVATVGDLDFAVATKNPEGIVRHIVSMPGVAQVVDKGDTKATVRLGSGVQLDFLLTHPDGYGALLQHFTGSKQHNIHLRTIAQKKGFSVSEYGVKKVKGEEIIKCEMEEELYEMLGMETPVPEIRENTGEIEAALEHKLPKLIELKDIKGDLHIHSSFPIEPSHDLGLDSPEDMIAEAKKMGYSYLGLSEHQPSVANHTPEQMVELIKRKAKLVEHINSSDRNTRVINLLEIDIMPDGSISVPDEALKLLDFAIAGVHSVHRMDKDKMTVRILKALANPYVKVLTHPTGRLLNERESFEADWPRIFEFAAKNNKALEINSFPNRLDLSDSLVREAKRYGVKFVINTDSHEASQMENMRFGVAVARRGWATKEDSVNAWDFKKFAKWFGIV